MYPINRLIVVCRKDPASVNIFSHIGKEGWDSTGSDGEFEYFRRGNDMYLSIPEKHLYTDDLDVRQAGYGFRPDLVIFPSVHSSASATPALTAHPIGNFTDAQYGGRPGRVVKAAPAAMSSALRSIKKYCTLQGYSICFEVTHHGPWLETPTFFLEIGSVMEQWKDPEAGALQAKVLEDSVPEEGYTDLLGVGGGHYAPRFTELALGYKVNFGHMLANYKLEGAGDEDVCRMLREGMEGTGVRTAYLHRKSMKASAAHRIRDLGESVGVEWIDSKDMEPAVRT